MGSCRCYPSSSSCSSHLGDRVCLRDRRHRVANTVLRFLQRYHGEECHFGYVVGPRAPWLSRRPLALESSFIPRHPAGLDCWKWIVTVNVPLVCPPRYCSEHLFYSFALSALRQESLFPWKGLPGESVRPGCPFSVQTGFTVSLEPLFGLSQAPGRVTQMSRSPRVLSEYLAASARAVS